MPEPNQNPVSAILSLGSSVKYLAMVMTRYPLSVRQIQKGMIGER